MTRWASVPGYEGIYEVSDDGQVKSLSRAVNNNGGLALRRERILSPALNPSGHYQVILHRDGEARTAGVHNLMMRAFVGPPPAGYEVCHNNGIPSDNRVENLRWGTRKANVQDSLSHGANYQKSKDFCKWGHEFSAENTTLIHEGKHRVCRRCAANRTANYRNKKKLQGAS